MIGFRPSALPLLLALASAAPLALTGCSWLIGVDHDDDDPEPGDGDGDGDLPIRTGDGDGDGDATGDGDGDATGDGDGDTTTGDGDGDGDGDNPGDGDGDGDGEPALDPGATEMTASPEEGLVANLSAASTITVRVFDTTGAPRAGVVIDLALVPEEGAVLGDTQLVTDASGTITTTLVASVPDLYEVSALTDVAGSPVALGSAQVTFDTCLSDEQFYDEVVEGPVFSRCIGCHNEWGRAREFGAMALQFPDEEGATAQNLETLGSLLFEIPADDGSGDLPYLLAKPTGATAHGGGVILLPGDEGIDLLDAFVAKLNDDTQCLPEIPSDLLAPVDVLTPRETLRKATLTLAGRVAGAAELAAFSGQEADLDGALDALMTEDGFKERLVELYNDFLLTDEGLPGQTSINQLHQQMYPRRLWFRPCSQGFNANNCCAAGECCIDDAGMDPAFCNEANTDGKDNEAIAREALELIEYIVLHDRPFTEVLTADYTMVNPFSAYIYGVEDLVSFDADPTNDRQEYKPVSLVPTSSNSLTAPLPHAGVLSAQRYLRRFPTTATNVNRHRARTIYQKFLDIDVMTFLAFTIDQNEELGDNPFTDARTCSACHAALDPIAGTFKNYRNGARYLVQPWYDENPNSAGVLMRVPAYKHLPLPQDRATEAVPWLGEQLAAEDRFAYATIKQLFVLLTGQDPVSRPLDPADERFSAHHLAYKAQTAYFRAQAEAFAADGYNLRNAIKRIILGPWYRAEALGGSVSDVHRDALDIAQVGMARTLTPEQLDRKLQGTLGYPYHVAGNSASANNLTNPNRFELLLGGHDSDVITSRFRDPFPIEASIVRRMSNEMACLAVPQELAWHDPAQRRFLRHVEKDTVPEDDLGTPIPANEAALKEDLAAMHLVLLGEEVSEGDAAFDESWDLFLTVWRGGKARLSDGTESNNLVGRCQALRDFYTKVDFDPQGSTGPGPRAQVIADPDYTIRAWMAVMSYLLSDYRFIFEG